MASLPLFQLINIVRSQLTQYGEFGELLSEKFLILDGDLCGQWFCFENVDIKWRFDSQQCEVCKNGEVVEELTVLQGESEELSRKAA